MPFVPKDQNREVAQSTNDQLTEDNQEVNNQNVEEMINEFQQLYCDLKEYLQDQSSFMEVTHDHVPMNHHDIQVEANPYDGAF